MANKRRVDRCFRLWAVLLIITALVSIILSFININNLLNDFIVELASFPYEGSVGEFFPFCRNRGFMAFGWSCGLLSFGALLTGLMIFGVEDRLNTFNVVFLFVSGTTAFVLSVVITVCSSMILACHVTFSGELPSSNLFISIFAVIQLILSLLAFFKVLKKRWEMASDAKYGIEPLPNPFELTVDPQNITRVDDVYNPKMIKRADDEFYRAMSQRGSHFNASYAQNQVRQQVDQYKMASGMRPVSGYQNAKQYVHNGWGNRSSAVAYG